MGITLDPLHPVVVATGQLDIPLRLRQGMMPQPLLEHRRGNPVENGVPPVGVPEGVRGARAGLDARLSLRLALGETTDPPLGV